MSISIPDYPDHEYPWRIPAHVPADRVLVHNKVLRPVRTQGKRGFRYWLQPPDERLERCPCAWAPELPEHYRVTRRTK